MENNKKTQKSVLEEAQEEFKKIMENASDVAKKKLSEEFKDKFDQLLNEEIDKIKTNSNTESNIKESSNEDTKNQESLNEDSKKESKKNDEKKEAVNEQEQSEKKQINEDEDFDMRELSLGEVEEAFDKANEEDEFEVEDEETPEEISVSLDDIEKELEQLEGITNEENSEEENIEEKDPDAKMKAVYEQLGEIIKEMEQSKFTNEMKEGFDKKMSEIYGDDHKEKLGEKYDELYEMYVSTNESKDEIDDSTNVKEQKAQGGKQNYSGRANGGPTNKIIDEREDYRDEKGDVPGEQDTGPHEYEKEVDEAHGVNLSNNKKAGADTQPRPEYAQYKKNKLRYALQTESYKKKLVRIINENKKLTKSLNEGKESFKNVENIAEDYKKLIGKFKNQINEMAIFNTNLANVNNLLVNEEITLSKEDRINIIESFKKIDSIEESDKKYDSLLNEMKESKGSINESLEKKLTGSSTAEASPEKINEDVYKKGNDLTEQVNKIKNVMNYIDKR